MVENAEEARVFFLRDASKYLILRENAPTGHSLVAVKPSGPAGIYYAYHKREIAYSYAYKIR